MLYIITVYSLAPGVSITTLDSTYVEWQVQIFEPNLINMVRTQATQLIPRWSLGLQLMTLSENSQL